MKVVHALAVACQQHSGQEGDSPYDALMAVAASEPIGLRRGFGARRLPPLAWSDASTDLRLLEPNHDSQLGAELRRGEPHLQRA